MVIKPQKGQCKGRRRPAEGGVGRVAREVSVDGSHRGRAWGGPEPLACEVGTPRRLGTRGRSRGGLLWPR